MGKLSHVLHQEVSNHCGEETQQKELCGKRKGNSMLKITVVHHIQSKKQSKK